METKQVDEILIKEYYEIIRPTDIKIAEWKREGDYFKKLSIYDDRYVSINTQEGTTLLECL
jgi:hypothetical protein